MTSKDALIGAHFKATICSFGFVAHQGKSHKFTSPVSPWNRQLAGGDMTERHQSRKKRLNDRFLTTYRLAKGDDRAEFTDAEVRGLTVRFTGRKPNSPTLRSPSR